MTNNDGMHIGHNTTLSNIHRKYNPDAHNVPSVDTGYIDFVLCIYPYENKRAGKKAKRTCTARGRRILRTGRKDRFPGLGQPNPTAGTGACNYSTLMILRWLAGVQWPSTPSARMSTTREAGPPPARLSDENICSTANFDTRKNLIDYYSRAGRKTNTGRPMPASAGREEGGCATLREGGKRGEEEELREHCISLSHDSRFSAKLYVSTRWSAATMEPTRPGEYNW